MKIISFGKYVEMREGLLLPDRPSALGLSRINPFPTTDAHRRRFKSKPIKASTPFQPTVRPVKEIVPTKLIPKLGRPRS